MAGKWLDITGVLFSFALMDWKGPVCIHTYRLEPQSKCQIYLAFISCKYPSKRCDSTCWRTVGGWMAFLISKEVRQVRKKNSFGNVMSVSTLIMKQKMMMTNYIYIFYRSQKTFLVRACFNIKHVTVKNNLQKGATSPIKQSLSKKISLNQ